jgi:hypothetical protein
MAAPQTEPWFLRHNVDSGLAAMEPASVWMGSRHVVDPRRFLCLKMSYKILLVLTGQLVGLTRKACVLGLNIALYTSSNPIGICAPSASD